MFVLRVDGVSLAGSCAFVNLLSYAYRAQRAWQSSDLAYAWGKLQRWTSLWVVTRGSWASVDFSTMLASVLQDASTLFGALPFTRPNLRLRAVGCLF